MAELRRVGGYLEPHRAPAGRRVLLPAEADLCNVVGLTEAEYWHFLELADAYTGERPEGYELIPDVRNDPVTLIINLVIGIALSAAAALLAPKPRTPDRKDPRNVKTEDVTGRSKFTPQTSFDSVQDLAALGAVIPLVFTRKGLRVNGQLLWSQMLSYGVGQQLRAIVLFSSGEIEGRPDFAGYAIGDTTLENYTNAKLALYFKSNGGRIFERGPERYPEGTISSVSEPDAFSLYWDRTGNYQPYFSGSRSPNTQTQFGCYSPAPNGMMHKPAFDAVVIPDGNKDNKERLRRKKSKVNSVHPYRAAVLTINNGFVVYGLSGSEDSGNDFEPWGSEDIRQSVNGAKEAVDASITVGEQYMIGTALTVCESVPARPWEPGFTKYSNFRIIEDGDIDVADMKAEEWTYARLTLQAVAIGTVSNNRSCNVTEIGIKSTVWSQVNGYANMNAFPGNDVLSDFGEDGGNFSLGTMNKYLSRLSFFTLETRLLGSSVPWTDISGGKLFCVRGRTPQPQYNYIRVNHDFAQWEFRFKPYPGNAAIRNKYKQTVWLLRPGNRMSFNSNGRTVTFDGMEFLLDDASTSNAEWIRGKPRDKSSSRYLEFSWNKHDALSDYPICDAERKSHMDGPEHEIIYVNEQVEQSAPQYDEMAIAGLRINSSKEWTNFSSLSAYFKRGVVVDRIGSFGRSATNLFPEIAYALLTDEKLGAGKLIGIQQVDRDRMSIAAKFCEANNFTWDGIVSERQNLREWIFENAGYCLLDFTIIGGRFSLIPSVPYNTDFSVNLNGKVKISALFTDGNVRNLQVSFLTPEERQLFIASVLWRQEKENGFPETRTLNVRLSNAQGGSDSDPIEPFDISGFCTSAAHALFFAKYALKLRKVVDHGLKFETTPQAAMNLTPGDYFKFMSEVTHTDRFSNGSIGPDGVITSANDISTDVTIIYWHPGTEGVKTALLQPDKKNHTLQSFLFNSVFTVSNRTANCRVYKVESLSYSEEGLVEVAASVAPLTDSGSLSVLEWGNADFVVESN